MSKETDAARGGRSGWRGIAQIVGIAVAALVALWFARAPRSQIALDAIDLAAPEAPAVTVIRPEPSAAAHEVRTTGAVTVLDGVRLFSQLPGEVIEIAPAFRNGGSFSAGETLVRIDPEEYENRVERIQAEVRAAEARVLRQQHKAEAKIAEFREKHPGQEPPRAITRVARIAEEEACADAARQRLAQAELQLSRTSISVPFDGRVANARISVGQVVARDTPLGLVYRNGGVQIEAQVSQEEALALEPVTGRRASVVAGGRAFTATVERVSAVVDRESRLVTLFLSFPANLSASRLPRPGTFTIVRLEGPEVQDVFVLPERAEQPGGGVWIVDGGALRSVSPVSLGRVAAGWLVESFDPGEGVVVGPVAGARPGLPVRVVE